MIHGLSSKFTFGAQSKPGLATQTATKTTHKRVEFAESKAAADTRMQMSPSEEQNQFIKSKTAILPPVLKQQSILRGTTFERASKIDRAVSLGPSINDNVLYGLDTPVSQLESPMP